MAGRAEQKVCRSYLIAATTLRRLPVSDKPAVYRNYGVIAVIARLAARLVKYREKLNYAAIASRPLSVNASTREIACQNSTAEYK